MTREFFLLKPVQNLYLGKVSERRLFSSFGFLWTHKKVTGGQFDPPARDRVKSPNIVFFTKMAALGPHVFV